MVFFLLTDYPQEIKKLIIWVSEVLEASQRSIICPLELLFNAILITSSFLLIKLYCVYTVYFYVNFFNKLTIEAEPVFEARYIGLWVSLSFAYKILLIFFPI